MTDLLGCQDRYVAVDEEEEPRAMPPGTRGRMAERLAEKIGRFELVR